MRFKREFLYRRHRRTIVKPWVWRAVADHVGLRGAEAFVRARHPKSPRLAILVYVDGVDGL